MALENLSRRQELAENLTRMRDENLQLRERLGVQSEIVGSSPLMARVTAGDRPGRSQPGHGADPRRERRGQGAGGAGGPLFQPAPQGAVRLPELRGPVARACWPANCSATSKGPSPAPRSARSASSRRPHQGTLDARRNRRNDAGHSGQVPARAGRASVRARRRHRNGQGRRAA